MQNKDLEVTCPCCSSRLTIDLRTRRVTRANRPEELDETGKPVVREADWTDALTKVRDRETGGENKLDAALDREKGRPDSLDDLFDRAKKKLDRDEE